MRSVSEKMKGTNSNLASVPKNDLTDVGRQKDKRNRSLTYVPISGRRSRKMHFGGTLCNYVKVVAENVVKRERRMPLVQVVERMKKINLKACHSCPMQYDIMVIYS
jgi:hypothetical protein